MSAAKLLHELTEVKTVEELMKISPWAWYSSELKVAFHDFKFPQKGLWGTRTKHLLAKEVGDRKIAMAFQALGKNKGTNMLMLRNEALVFRYVFQPTRRMLIEYACLEKKDQPEWFRFLIFLCKNPGEHTLKQIGGAIKARFSSTWTVENHYPPIFKENVVFIQGNTGPNLPNRYAIHPEFYEKIYKPIEDWLSEDGISAFKMWKSKYHYRKNSKT
ncbi:TPA: hypothetical protein H1012_03445 [archaeon]|nr:hypothetical protein [Candidatus Naiadarchaeales archaeon SRR2090159.bin1288]